MKVNAELPGKVSKHLLSSVCVWGVVVTFLVSSVRDLSSRRRLAEPVLLAVNEFSAEPAPVSVGTEKGVIHFCPAAFRGGREAVGLRLCVGRSLLPQPPVFL